jgi:hypothetical protein
VLPPTWNEKKNSKEKVIRKETKKKKKRGKHTKTNPLAQQLPIRDLDQRNLVLGAQRHNQLLVRLFLTPLVENAHMRLSPVQRLRSLPQTTRKTVVDQRDLQHALQRVQDGHLARARTGAGVSADFDLIGFGDGGVGSGLFSVRL